MKTVMLVEDEQFILEGLQNIIDWEALSMKIVHLARNGEEALELFEKEPVDIVVTDVEMPVMDGLGFLEALRRKNTRTRCIILTGYDEFEYARKAVPLDVEDYILKPIDEEKLEQVLRLSSQKLEEMDSRRMDVMEDQMGWRRYLEGRLKDAEAAQYEELLPVIRPDQEQVFLALMNIEEKSLREKGMGELLASLRGEKKKLKPLYLSPKELLLFLYWEHRDNSEESMMDHLSALQDRLEEELGIFTFISASGGFTDYKRLPEAYKICTRLQKYKMIDGYGSCLDESHIQNRTSKDVAIDDMSLRKMILKKDKDGAINYIEDLFINNIREAVDVDVLYQVSLKIALLLHDIKYEYKLGEAGRMKDLTEMVENIYHAEDLFVLKTVFISEITGIITQLHTEDSHYTPVVKQLMEEVRKNYREDMNLKTLAYKYHMNASYLGQIFQKEVGCSFNQYLNNTKNGIAKDLILNTNKKIIDIAREVGYPDTSYFYRKFKQCYGVSPASLRDMKKYDIGTV